MKYTKATVVGLLVIGVLFAQLPVVSFAQSNVVVERVNFLNLKSGSDEARVSALKEVLRTIPVSLSAGCASLSTTNTKYGPTTEACVKAFQKMNMLLETGIVDEATNRALNSSIEQGISGMPFVQKMAVLPQPSTNALTAGQVTSPNLENLRLLLLKLQEELKKNSQ
jgi:peptidoglycan hydrolase-like protein with peptidoglycan-binding domain